MSYSRKFYTRLLANVLEQTVFFLNDDITKCLDTYCNNNNNLYVSTTAFIT